MYSLCFLFFPVQCITRQILLCPSEVHLGMLICSAQGLRGAPQQKEMTMTHSLTAFEKPTQTAQRAASKPCHQLLQNSG